MSSEGLAATGSTQPHPKRKPSSISFMMLLLLFIYCWRVDVPSSSVLGVEPCKTGTPPSSHLLAFMSFYTYVGGNSLVQLSEELCKDCHSRAPSSQEMKRPSTPPPNTLLGVIPGVPIEHSWVGLKPNKYKRKALRARVIAQHCLANGLPGFVPWHLSILRIPQTLSGMTRVQSQE